MNVRIALFVSLITVSAIHANDEDISSTVTSSVISQDATPTFLSKVFTTITSPLIWTKDTTLAVTDSITNNTLGKITGISYLQGGVLDNNKIAIGRIALLAATLVATQKAYNWYIAQQEANDNADFIDFNYEPDQDQDDSDNNYN